MVNLKVTSLRKNGKPVNAKTVMYDVARAIRAKGYTCEVSQTTSTAFSIGNIRLSQERIKKHGYNISPYSGRRGRVLSWDDWVNVNNAINAVLNRKGISANVSSLGGKVRVREGTRAYERWEWENNFGYDNVGSRMNPVHRMDGWKAEKKLSKKEIKRRKNFWSL